MWIRSQDRSTLAKYTLLNIGGIYRDCIVGVHGEKEILLGRYGNERCVELLGIMQKQIEIKVDREHVFEMPQR